MTKLRKSFRLESKACEVIHALASELGVSEAVVIEGWAMDHDKKNVMTERSITAEPTRVSVYAPIENGPGLLAKLRADAKPLTRAVQMHQAKD